MGNSMKPLSQYIDPDQLSNVPRGTHESRREWALKQNCDTAIRVFKEFLSMGLMSSRSWNPMTDENDVFLKAKINWQMTIKDVPEEILGRAILRVQKCNKQYFPSLGQFEDYIRSVTPSQSFKRIVKPKPDRTVALEYLDQMKRRIKG